MLDEQEEEAAPPKMRVSVPSSDSFDDDDTAALDGLLGPRTVNVSEDESERGSDAESTNKDLEDDDEDLEDDELPTFVPQLRFQCPCSWLTSGPGKHAMRVDIATKEGFPTDHEGFGWGAISEFVAVLQAPELVERLAIAKEFGERRSQLNNYIQRHGMARHLQLRGEVESLCRVLLVFGIPRDYIPAQIATHIEWLTGKTSIFKYGGINLECIYEADSPSDGEFVERMGYGGANNKQIHRRRIRAKVWWMSKLHVKPYFWSECLKI
ncbi:hypothetical protein B0H19DRAFT_1085095 [Mycena capillaripes]|nr:hypothetical protein B0H19DRAFT_1085095 [Mycena capillaripes]